MNEYQRFGVGYYLSDYPADWDYDRVIETLSADDEESHEHIVIWEPFEDYPPDQICDMIDELVDALEIRFIPKVEVSNV